MAAVTRLSIARMTDVCPRMTMLRKMTATLVTQALMIARQKAAMVQMTAAITALTQMVTVL